MERFVEIFKRHPWWIVGAVIGVVILIWFFSRGSSGTGATAVYSSGPTDAQVQGAYALQAAQISANASVASAQLANEKSANDNATAVVLNSQNTGAATTINAQNTSAATTINSQNATAAVQINGQNTTTAQAMNEINANSAVAINAAQVNSQVAIAGYQRDAEINGQNTAVQVQSMAEDTARFTSIMNMLGATNPKGGMATYVTTNGQIQTVGLNNRNPFGMPK